ncbi:hypothetical protein E2C01_041092 [Portunus trituberculatus]|uniref:Uncharacterized protein n=1 Tax=Portunus trituberculatus TaxID=210409 RepID=A0A5B7FIA9_PORTR|nr:hypothetical protein [Portunus trituberculatus]
MQRWVVFVSVPRGAARNGRGSLSNEGPLTFSFVFQVYSRRWRRSECVRAAVWRRGGVCVGGVEDCGWLRCTRVAAAGWERRVAGPAADGANCTLGD